MIETTKKIDYSKSKTLTCDDNFLSLKSEKTLNIDTDTDKYDILLNENKKKKKFEILSNKYKTSKNNRTSSNSINNDEIKSNLDFCSSVNSTHIFISNNSQRNSKKSDGEKNISKKSNNSKKGSNQYTEKIEKSSCSNSMYDKNSINTKYYDNFNYDSKKSNNNSFHISEKENDNPSKSFKDNTISKNNNSILEEKELFVKHIEKKKKMNNFLCNYAEAPLTKCRISDINKSNIKNHVNKCSNNYTLNIQGNSKSKDVLNIKNKKIETFLDYNSQNLTFIANKDKKSYNKQNNCKNQSDNTKECVKKNLSKLYSKNDYSKDTIENCYNYQKLDNNLNFNNIKYTGIQNNDKTEENINNKDDNSQRKKENFKSMLNRQDASSDMENVNNNTLRNNSMKYISKPILTDHFLEDKSDKNLYPKVPETPINLKEINMQDKNSISSEYINENLSESDIKLENKIGTFSNLYFSSIENNMPIIHEDNYEINNSEINQNKNPNKSVYDNNDTNRCDTEFTNNIYEEDFNFNKKTDYIKQKNDKTLSKSQFHEYNKNTNEDSINNLGKKKKNYFYDIVSKKRIESVSVTSTVNNKDCASVDEYILNTIPKDIMKNVKYENPSNTYNEIINNITYDLTSELNNNNSIYISEKNKKNNGEETKEVDYILNEKIESCKESQFHKNDNITKKTIMCNEPEIDYSHDKRYLLSTKKNEVIKDQKSQMLLISKQKIKKIWNKFKINSPKEQNNTTYDNKKYLSPNPELLNSQKLKNSDHNYPKGCVINKSMNCIYNMEKQIKSKCIFNWRLAQKALIKMLHCAHNYYFNGVKYSDWNLTSIPTLGFSKSSNRVQQMFKATVVSKDGNSRNEVKLFIKKIPIYIWVKQFNLMNEYSGEYVTDGENFVMEASALAFLNEYHQGITPKLHKILYEPESKHFNEYISPKVLFNNLVLFNDILTERLKCNINGNIVIVSEFFSEDILDYIDRRQKKYNMKISNNEKSYILYQCLKLLIKLHDAGLSHLDLTPENILISENYEMRLCDLSKSTPIYTYNLRHIKDSNRLYLFESCEPTIAKGAYMPPECWKIYWKYDTMKIKNPLKDLKSITDQEKRKQFYFDVSSADKFMLGVFFFWIWTNGNLWKCSDPLQDEDFFYFIKCDMDFNKFELTKKWPDELKHIIKQLLHIDYRKKLNLKDLNTHPWWSCKL